MNWFYSSQGNRMGPVAPVAFETLIADHTIQESTLVWSEGEADWSPWSKVASETAVCAVSGGRYWKKNMVPYEGRFISAEHKERYFQRVREGLAPVGTMVYGNFWPRFWAKALDGVIMWIPSRLVGMILAFALVGSAIARPTRVDGKFMLLSLVMAVSNLLLQLLYYWAFLRTKEATPGKMALGLKVVRSDGTKLSDGRIVARYFSELLSGLILCVGYIMAAFDDERRALHDRICDTRVIKSR